ncbi:MAG TPA: chromosome segregation protein SMC [Gemmata sp.]|jgi:chromosome segregation protein|nr:chromosome segregation protein SMC [Gemmata sp.]
MLKRLELVGFKSFAEKTRFDFASGITGVVGPNGSGKSNVVDAVRWILGEQSAKSLRGGEMADVIFNGSSSRKSLGLAEVTVAFDNNRRLLAVDADEVQLTRRVYRDGTGEYLINGQLARLKDFKEIFLGSGAGAHGYTIIAQGRVDELLQATTRDRREIFDEAAGISRFKARKTETLRKLAAVEANVTRSQDRLNGLEAQLRTLRIQASKAQKCKEYNERLRELRIGLGTREYRQIAASLDSERQLLLELQAEVTGVNRRSSDLERSLRELDKEVMRSEDGLRHQEGRLADARQLIAEFDVALKHERTSTTSLEAEQLKLGRQRAELGYRIKAIEADIARAMAEATAADELLKSERQTAESARVKLETLARRVVEIDREVSGDRERQYQLVSESSAARSTATASLAQVERLQKEHTRKRADIEQSSARRRTLAETLDGHSRADADLQVRLTTARERHGHLRTDREGLSDRLRRVQATLEGLRVRQGDLRGRMGILEELERSLDGLGLGVRFVLQRLKDENQSSHETAESTPVPISFSNDIVGLVADLLTVPHDISRFVELALGDTAQQFVVRSSERIDGLAAMLGDIPGRVGFVPYRQWDEPSGDSPRFNSQSSVNVSRSSAMTLSLASRIECELPGLPHQLLGNVLLADSLLDARDLHAANPGHRIVARSGELLEPDGTLTVGPLKVEAGLVSRKSELRELRDQYRVLTEEVTNTESELTELRRKSDAAAGVIEAVESEISLLSGEAGDLQQKIAIQRQQVVQLDEMCDLLRQEIHHLEQEVQRGEAGWVAARLKAEESEQAAENLKSRLVELQREMHAAEESRDAAQQANTSAQVALSRAVLERDRTKERAGHLEVDLRKRRVEAVDLSTADRSVKLKLSESTMTMLRASSGQADAYREKEHRERLVNELSGKASIDRAARERVRDELQMLRTGWQEKQSQAHAKELAVHDLMARREGIVGRIRDDYGVDLAVLIAEMDHQELAAETEPTVAIEEPETPVPEPSQHEVQQEIEELRRKLARLGSVNMEALEELARVETEFKTLQAQHEDLNAARKSLQDVIDAINTDSRKLFVQTLTAVRAYFQELFRKLFGGGQADIVLENEADVLESGIEITARPPGKELRSLSLLSGGEKTLTAIALLLAIFRNKPSPFCILDEVDAALDESNTTRLAGVLREFLDLSQFIVVTHKKRTMAAADRLWGVTMQESGVSRLLPMRFEDWQEEEVRSEIAS